MPFSAPPSAGESPVALRSRVRRSGPKHAELSRQTKSRERTLWPAWTEIPVEQLEYDLFDDAGYLTASTLAGKGGA